MCVCTGRGRGEEGGEGSTGMGAEVIRQHLGRAPTNMRMWMITVVITTTAYAGVLSHFAFGTPGSTAYLSTNVSLSCSKLQSCLDGS